MSVTEWGPVEIEQWLARLQFPHAVVSSFTSHNITGETLPYLKDSHLQEMALSLDDRIRIKIEINRLLFDNGLHRDEDFSVQHILKEVQKTVQQSLDAVTRDLEQELARAKDEMAGKLKPLPTPDRASPASPFTLSPTKLTQQRHSTVASPVEGSSLRRADKRRSVVQSPTRPTMSSTPSMGSLASQNTSSSELKQQQQQQQQQPMSEPLKQLRASTDDPCSKLLQAAMKRHKLNDDWRNYALVICYGDKERLLKLDEKPVQIFKELKEKGEHPAIMLRQVDYAGESRGNNTPGGML